MSALMVPSIQTEFLRLHCTPKGELWYGDDVRLSEPAGGHFLSWVEQPGRFDDVRFVRVLATQNNARLIVALADLKAGGRLPPSLRIQLGPPELCGRHFSVGPTTALERAWHACVTSDPAVRWLELGPRDRDAYTLVAAYGTGTVTEECLALLPKHPAWPAVSFVTSSSPRYAATLLAEMIDPRWFIHHERPGRLNRLYDWLGLNESNFWAIVSGDTDEGGRGFFLAYATYMALGGGRPPPGTRDPRDFLGRIFISKPTPAVGMLAAARKFVRFVREVWIGECYPTVGFDPDLFFRSPEEAAAYRCHRASLRPN